MRLKDKVCVITGGGSGIGRATALLFAGEGPRLVVDDKHEANAQAVASQCASKGAQAIATAADVASAADVKRIIAAAVERFRRLDILVNNAGYGIPGSVVETDEDAWDALMAVNVRGVFLCSKYAIPVMKANGGRPPHNPPVCGAPRGARHGGGFLPPKGGGGAAAGGNPHGPRGGRPPRKRDRAGNDRPAVFRRHPEQDRRCRRHAQGA